MYFLKIEVSKFWGNLRDVLAKPATLVETSVAVVAEISLRLPRKLFIFIDIKYIYWIKITKIMLIKFWKKLHWLRHVM